MKILIKLSTILSYFTAFGGVTSIYEWLRYGGSEAIPIGIALFILSILLSYPADKKINGDPIAFMFMIRGIVSLYTFFIVQSSVFLIIPAVLIVTGIMILYVPPIISSLWLERKRQNYIDAKRTDSLNYKKDESIKKSEIEDLKVEKSDSVIFSEEEVFSKEKDTKQEESIKLEKKNGVEKIIILLLTLVSYVLFFIVATSIINEWVFPNYLGGDGIFDLLIYLSIGVGVRYLTLLRYELKQRFIIIFKNIFAFILVTSILGFLSLKGFVILVISLILTIYLDIKSPNSKIEWLRSGPFLKSPKKVIFVVVGFLLIYFSLRMGVYNMNMETSLSQINGLREDESSKDDNDLIEFDSYINDSDERASVLEKENESRIFDPQERLRQIKEEMDRYMGDSEKLKKTTAGIQLRLKYLGYYESTVDGMNGPLTREAIINYKRDNFDYNSDYSIDEYANEFITLDLIKKLGIPEP